MTDQEVSTKATKAKAAMVILEPLSGVESVTSIDSTKNTTSVSSSSPSNRFNNNSYTIAIDSSTDNNNNNNNNINNDNNCSSQNEFEMSPRDDSSSSQVEFETDIGKTVEDNNGHYNGAELIRSQGNDDNNDHDDNNDEGQGQGQGQVALNGSYLESSSDAVEMILQDDSNDNEDDNDIDIDIDNDDTDVDVKLNEGVRLPQDPQNDNDGQHCRSDEAKTDGDIRTAPSPSRMSDNVLVHDKSMSPQRLHLRDISLNESQLESAPHSPNADTAKDLILVVTREDELEDYDSQEDDTDDHDHEQEEVDSQHEDKDLILAVTREDELEDYHCQEDIIGDESNQQQQHQEQNDDASIMKKDIRISYSSPLRVSTDFSQLLNQPNANANAAKKSPMRSESPAMLRRREELSKSQRSIQQLEEQLNLVPKDRFQPYQHHQHQLDFDDGASMDSTITSTPSLGLLLGSSRTLLTSTSSKLINDSSQIQLHHGSGSSPKRQQSPKKIGSPEMRKAYATQRDSSRLLQSPPRQASAKSFGGETLVTNNASPVVTATPKAANNNNNEFEMGSMTPTEDDKMKAFYENKLANQRSAHEDQIDEIIEQLTSIETTYGKEIASLKDRLSKKQIMTEALTNSLTSYQIKNGEIKQQYEITLTKLDEARQEFDAEHERYAALMRELERAKMKAVESAREEIRVAAERQFASAQKTFVKLKQDFTKCSEERDFFQQKFGALESKERAQEATISKLMAESADANAKMATEKAEALKMKVEIEKSVNSKIEKADRKCAEAYAVADKATEAKEALKKENSDLQSLCEELMAIVEGGRAK